MKKLITLLFVVMSVLLAACAAPQATTAPQATAAQQAAATQATLPAATAMPGGQPVPATGDDIRAYTIDAAQSKARYEVGEVFINQNNRFNLAVGVSNVVTGEVLLNFTDPSKSTLSEITVDISQLTSDSSRRDNAIRGRWLESQRFPIAKFNATQIEGLPADPNAYSPGSDLNFKVTGDMTIRDVTRPVTFDVTAKLNGNTLSGSASTKILMSDFSFQAPDIAGLLKAENEAKVVFDFVANKK